MQSRKRIWAISRAIPRLLQPAHRIAHEPIPVRTVQGCDKAFFVSSPSVLLLIVVPRVPAIHLRFVRRLRATIRNLCACGGAATSPRVPSGEGARTGAIQRAHVAR